MGEAVEPPRQASIIRRATISAVVLSGFLGGLGALAVVTTQDPILLGLWLGLGVPLLGLALVMLVPIRKLKRALKTIQWSLEKVRAGDFTVELPPPREREAELFRATFMSMREEILRGRALLELRDRERRRLYSHVVHDMATPLTTLMMSTDGLEGGAKPEQLARIESELDALRELVERLRLLSVMEHPDFAPKPEAVALGLFVAELLAAYPPSAAVSGHADAVTLLVCPKTLKAALRNLIDNAVAASRGAPVVVTVTADATGGCTVVIVDGGEGFAQTGAGLDVPVTPPRLPSGIRGSGLGLMIARAAVASLRATLTLENRPEGGGRVRVVLPGASPTGPELSTGSAL